MVFFKVPYNTMQNVNVNIIWYHYISILITSMYILCQYNLFFKREKIARLRTEKSGDTTNCSAEIKHMVNKEYMFAVEKHYILLNWSQYLTIRLL